MEKIIVVQIDKNLLHDSFKKVEDEAFFQKNVIYKQIAEEELENIAKEAFELEKEILEAIKILLELDIEVNSLILEEIIKQVKVKQTNLGKF